MSLTLDSSPAPEAPSPDPAPPRRVPPWLLAVLAVALLAGSAGLRLWQQGRVDAALRSGRVSPFPLASIPRELGPWVGEDDDLDPRIAAGTGATDMIVRTYTNEQTGVRVSLIVLYGPATDVFIHAPEICYPAAGYAVADGPQVRTVELGGAGDGAGSGSGSGGRSVPFYAHTFVRGQGGQQDVQRVFCTWRHQGRWSPQRLNYKQYERIPGMYKVHLTRLALPGELFEARDPCEDLLALLLPDIEQRLEASGRLN